ncbi:MAG TPA: menaquinone biosynthesis protein [Candidatus Acidoferrum sp.]|nr:menaquinone biosynthesis protein [Candidatus Acidoferrum sp.]
MTRLRISVVQYLNTAPLVRGFTHGPLRGKYDLSFTVPSQCAEALRSGAADVAIIPAIEYPRIVASGLPLAILPNLAIASKERVRSLLVISKVPIRQARRIALDRSSRSTQALVRILAARRWQIAPEFLEAAPDPDAMLATADAALLIGDAALRIAIAAEASPVKPGPDAEWLAPAAVLSDPPTSPHSDSLVAAQHAAPAKPPREASSAEPPVGPQHRCAPARQDLSLDLHPSTQLHIYDVVKEWWHLTEKPAVLAIWAARNHSFPDGLIPAELTADFQASRDFGLTQIPQIAAEAAAEMHLPEKELRLYLQKNIDYSLDDDNFQGLQRFFNESQTLNLIAPLQSIAIAAGPHSHTRYINYTYAKNRA